MRTQAHDNLEAQKLEIRNLQRRLNNAEHTYTANMQELVNMIREKMERDLIHRQEECCEYWKTEIEKVEGKVFLICLESGLSEERAWE
jgi:RNA polymerase-binding transcription factor DksA